MNDNRRRSPRHDVCITAEVYLGERVLEGQTRNISDTGVNVVVDEELPDGGQVIVVLLRTLSGIEDPDTEPLSLTASVVWSAPNDAGAFMAGLRFGELNAEQAVGLADFIIRVTSAPPQA